MKLLNRLSGGYRRVMDRVLDLQSEMIVMGNAPFASLQYDLVLSGCEVHDNENGTVNIAPGLMYVDGNTLRFDGANNVAANGSMAINTGAAVASVLRPFADGSNKNLYSEQKAVVGVQDVDNPFQLKIRTTLYNLQQYIKDQINAADVKGSIKEIYDLDGTFGDNFDVTGLGITPAWSGWALDNGNNGTVGSAGMVLLATGTYTDPITGLETVFNPGDTMGELKHVLTIEELPEQELNIGLDIKHDDGGAAGVKVLSSLNPGPGGNGTIAFDIGGDGEGHNIMQPSRAVYRVVKIV